MHDMFCTTVDITSTLSHQTTVFMMSHRLQAWHHTHWIRHRTHCIFVITASPLISYPLLYDIIPTIWMTTYALYITSSQFLMSSHYCTYAITASIYESTSCMEGHIYTIHVTSQPLICAITLTLLTTSLTLCMTSHSDNVWHLLHYTRHHISALWPQTTVFMSSHPLYWTSCLLYLCHHIHCIDDITPTVSLRSHLL